MKTLKIYDPAMCCSTGVCGPSVDQKLVNLAADVAFLKSHGVEVERFNLGHQPEAFTASPLIMSEMGTEAQHLPIFVLDGQIKAKGTYPGRDELAAWFGLVAERLSGKLQTNLPMATSKCCDSDGEGCC